MATKPKPTPNPAPEPEPPEDEHPPPAMAPNPEPGAVEPPTIKYTGDQIPSELLKPGPMIYVPDVEARVAALEDRMTALEARVAAPPIGLGKRP